MSVVCCGPPGFHPAAPQVAAKQDIESPTTEEKAGAAVELPTAQQPGEATELLALKKELLVVKHEVRVPSP